MEECSGENEALTSIDPTKYYVYYVVYRKHFSTEEIQGFPVSHLERYKTM